MRCKKCRCKVLKSVAPQFGPFYCQNCGHLQKSQVEDDGVEIEEDD